MSRENEYFVYFLILSINKWKRNISELSIDTRIFRKMSKYIRKFY